LNTNRPVSVTACQYIEDDYGIWPVTEIGGVYKIACPSTHTGKLYLIEHI